MNDMRRLHLSFAPTFSHVDMVRAAVNGICSDFFQLSSNAASVLDFCLIITELMNNAVEHTDNVVLHAEIFLADREAVFRLISAGKSFDPTQTAAMPNLKQDDLPEGGYGLAMIQSLADGMEYERRQNRNMVTLHKTFPLTTEKEA
ncbi:MAG: ATP-binding protein [Desulfuromonadales bacterium]|nr:ATP-binding protein [Desulfuromonadales bacterium]